MNIWKKLNNIIYIEKTFGTIKQQILAHQDYLKVTRQAKNEQKTPSPPGWITGRYFGFHKKNNKFACIGHRNHLSRPQIHQTAVYEKEKPFNVQTRTSTVFLGSPTFLVVAAFFVGAGLHLGAVSIIRHFEFDKSKFYKIFRSIFMSSEQITIEKQSEKFDDLKETVNIMNQNSIKKFNQSHENDKLIIEKLINKSIQKK